MTSSKYKALNALNSIHFETELLEALDWNEDEFKKCTVKINEYFNVCSKSDLDLISVDLGLIFSEEIVNIIIRYVEHTRTALKKGKTNET